MIEDSTLAVSGRNSEKLANMWHTDFCIVLGNDNIVELLLSGMTLGRVEG